MNKLTAKKISFIAIFSAVSVIGAMIKIPGPVGSVAFDSAPAVVAAILLGPGTGAAVAGLGHLLSALLGGMPLGPFHFLIGAEMAVLLFIFARLYDKNSWLGLIFFILANGFLLGLPFIFIFGMAFYLSLLPSLLTASILNGIVGMAVAGRVRNRKF